STATPSTTRACTTTPRPSGTTPRSRSSSARRCARERRDGRCAVSAPKLDPAVYRVIAVVLLGPFMSQMDSTVVNVSLSAIRDELHASTESAQWIVSGYLLALALVL